MRDFLFSHTGFEPGTSGSLVQHSTSAPQQLLVFNSDNFRYLTLVQRDWWWHCPEWTCESFSFWPHQGLIWDLWISSPALYHCAQGTSGFHLWQFQVFNSGAERLVVILFWMELWEVFFLPTPAFELGTSGYLVLHSSTAPQQLFIFTFDNFRYLTLVQRDLWWYCSDWTCGEIFFLPPPGFYLGTSGSLVLHSTTVPWWLLVFTSDNFTHLTLVQRIGGGIVLIGSVRDFLFGHTRDLNRGPLDL